MKNKDLIKDTARYSFILVVLIALIIALSVLLSACKTRYRYVPDTRIEYRDRYRASQQADTLFVSDTLIVKDSVIVRQRGDSVMIDRLRYELRIMRSKAGKSRTDTLYQRDSIFVKQPIPIEVEKSRIPRWAVWQVGGFWALVAGLIFFVLRRWPLSIIAKIFKR